MYYFTYFSGMVHWVDESRNFESLVCVDEDVVVFWIKLGVEIPDFYGLASFGSSFSFLGRSSIVSQEKTLLLVLFRCSLPFIPETI
jgi:hypothetical protein